MVPTVRRNWTCKQASLATGTVPTVPSSRLGSLGTVGSYGSWKLFVECPQSANLRLIEPVLSTPFNAVGEGVVQPTLHYIRIYFRIIWLWIDDVGLQIYNRSARQWPEPGLAGTYRLSTRCTFGGIRPHRSLSRIGIGSVNVRLLSSCLSFLYRSYRVLPVQSGDKSED
jgi:hypothetical protein